jgi:hypothetical protein
MRLLFSKMELVTFAGGFAGRGCTDRASKRSYTWGRCRFCGVSSLILEPQVCP